MIPQMFRGRTIQAGNASLGGACMILLDEKLKTVLKQQKAKLKNFDLAMDENFQAAFISALNFPLE